MSPLAKKILLIAGFVIICILIGWLLWRVFFSSVLTPPSGDVPGTGTSTPQLPDAGTGTGGIIGSGTGTGNLPTTDRTATPPTDGSPETAAPTATTPRTTVATPLTTVPARYPHLTADGTAAFYDRESGQFFRLAADGRQTALSDRRFYNVERVTWSRAGDKAVLEYPDGANIIYNFTTGEQATLPAHWQEFDFSPAGDQVATKSIGLDRDSRWLITANDDGSGARLVEPLGDNGDKVTISWSPNNLSVATFADSVDFDQQRLYFVGQNKENFKAATIEGRGLEHRWDPAGNRLLYSVYSSRDDLKPRLWIVDAKGESIGNDRRDLGIQTWVHKCAFANANTVYCAVPTSLPEGAGLFPELAAGIPDAIYRINITTGVATLAAQPQTPVTIETLIVNEAGTDLYFTPAGGDGLYHIGL